MFSGSWEDGRGDRGGLMVIRAQFARGLRVLGAFYGARRLQIARH